MSNVNTTRTAPRRTLVSICVFIAASIATPVWAIEAPAAAPASEAPNVSAFHEKLTRSAHRRRFDDLKIDANVIDALTRADVANAVSSLTTRAEAGDHASNAALVRVQHWCTRLRPDQVGANPKMLESLNPFLSGEQQAEVAALLVTEREYQTSAQQSCRNARFDFRTIESQLREAADAGELVSATELAKLESNPTRAQALLEKAASANYAPAQYQLGVQRLMAVQRGETTANVSTIRVLLKQAGRVMPKAKLDLANCMAYGCDGHPADVASAAVFGMDAVRDGEFGAYPALIRMPWGARVPAEQRLAWQYFGMQLAQQGCYGDEHLAALRMLGESIAVYEKRLSADAQKQARELADQYWKTNGARAQREQRCDAPQA